MKPLTLFVLLIVLVFFASCEEETEVPAKNDTTTTTTTKPNFSTTSKDGETVVSQNDEPPVDGTVFSKYYLDVYVDADTIITIQQTFYEKLPVITVAVEGLQYDSRGWSGKTNYERNGGNLAASGKRNAESLQKENFNVFDSIAKLIGDTCFYNSGVPFARSVVNDTIMGIEVVCNEDYDDMHKAGCSVSDIIDFYGSSPYEYIQNGYKEIEPENRPQIVFDYGLGTIWDVTNCNISDIADAKLKYFEDHFYLVFVKLPAQSGTYTFDVSLQLSQKTLKNTVTMEF